MQLRLVLDHLQLSKDAVCSKMNITGRMYDRMVSDVRYIKPWMMRMLIDKWKVNPLYVYEGRGLMFLDNLKS